jgi:bifunctional DNA-binding transcriptional regulator/antitoxin component of YhaV-PrlF toxin-antitoxin module
MSRVTPELQVTLPEAIADKYQIRPGDEVEWIEAGQEIRIAPAKALPRMLSTSERLRIFDDATSRQRTRETEAPLETRAFTNRGWTREEIYDRHCAR